MPTAPSHGCGWKEWITPTTKWFMSSHPPPENPAPLVTMFKGFPTHTFFTACIHWLQYSTPQRRLNHWLNFALSISASCSILSTFHSKTSFIILPASTNIGQGDNNICTVVLKLMDTAFQKTLAVNYFGVTTGTLMKLRPATKWTIHTFSTVNDVKILHRLRTYYRQKQVHQDH
jgi:hypothetical protein